jgi:multiple antibiotic resistance protein
MTAEIIRAIVTIFSLVNPVICVSIFANLQSQNAKADQYKAALKAMLMVAVILSLSAVGGAKVLDIFGISLQAFSVAGGLILAWMGFSMLSKKPNKPDASDHSSGPGNATITPLVMFAASPGTITGVITLSVSHSAQGLPVTALIAVMVVCLITLLMLVASVRVEGGDVKPESLGRDMMSRFMGLIVLAMGVQFTLAGLKGFLV